MDTEILQVRDVPSADVAVLRARAAARSMSLSAYLRELIHDDASRPELGEVLQRISSREPVELGTDDILAAIVEGRR